jgi:hypothetical protein
MLDDPKSLRFAESFVSQWLGINKLKDPNAPLADLAQQARTTRDYPSDGRGAARYDERL